MGLHHMVLLDMTPEHDLRHEPGINIDRRHCFELYSAIRHQLEPDGGKRHGLDLRHRLKSDSDIRPGLEQDDGL